MKPLLRLATDRPLEASAEFKIGVGSAPYLADHGVQGMVVLPGSFFIEMALCVDRELSKTVPALVRNVTFHEPIVLSADDTTIHVEVKDRGDGRFEYTFSEAGVENRRAVTLEIDRNESIALDTGIDGFSIEAFQAQSHAVIDSGPFYKTLSDNGNQYGPRFQPVVSIWRAGDQSLGRLSLARQDEGIEPSDVQTILLDSVTQLLAPFVIEKRKTFLLRSIEKVEVANRHVADPLWGHATLLPPVRGGGPDRDHARWYCDRCGKTWDSGLESSTRPRVIYDGFDEHMGKPLELDALTRAIERLARDR